jgi:hypothetical protein
MKESIKYIVCIPRGCGFNDILCQINEAHKFAQTTGRILIIDTRLSGLADNLSKYMSVEDCSESIQLHLADETLEKINTMTCFPKEFEGKINWIFDRFWAIESKKLNAWLRFDLIRRLLNLAGYVLFNNQKSQAKNKVKFLLDFLKIRGKDLRIDLKSQIENDAQVIIHHMSGGGEGSIKSIGLFRLKNEIRSKILSKIKSIGDKYDAIHIRHTDYQTDFISLFESIAPNLTGKRVLICSDNPYVLLKGSEIFKGAEVITWNPKIVTDLSKNKARPLHFQWNLPTEQIFENNINMLSDLIALANATNLYIGKLENNIFDSEVSGFSKLALNLHENPTVLERWIGLRLSNV